MMSTFMKNAVEYGTFYVGETTEGMVILHPDVFETEKQHYQLLRGEQWHTTPLSVFYSRFLGFCYFFVVVLSPF
jgi:hypothetical protein